MGLVIRKAKNQPWGWRYLNPKQRSHQKIHQQSKRANVAAEAAGEGQKSYEGASAVYVV